MSRHANPLQRFILATSIVAVAALGIDATMTGAGSPLGRDTWAFLLFWGCCLVTELNPLRWLRRDGGGEITASWTFMLALLLSGPPVIAVGGVAAAVLLGDLAARKGARRLLFNVSQMIVSLTAAAGVLVAAGQSRVLLEGRSPGPLWLAATVVAGVTAFAVNQVLTCTVLALHQGTPVLQMVRDEGTSNLSTDGMLLASSPIFVVVAQRSLLLLPLLLVTTWTVYRSAELAMARRHDATHDQLTKLPNRRLFDEHLDRAVAAALEGGERLGLVLLDLDGFKEVNDRLGHQAGDAVLREVASRLAGGQRRSDLVARLGGDEFAIVVPHLETAEGAAQVAARIHALFDAPCTSNGLPLRIGASIGIAVVPDHATDAWTALQRADAAMYRAKAGGGGVMVHEDAAVEAPPRHFTLVGDIGAALSDGHLSCRYQPKVDLGDGRITGVEALVRWSHPTAGLLMPSAFMPLVEQSEFIGAVTEHVLDTALAQARSWADDGVPLRVAVNISAHDLADTRFPALVGRLLSRHSVPGGDLVLEITENAVAHDVATARLVLDHLRALGVSISVDDFGTGWSSLGHLAELPVDELKIDRRFVSAMVSDERSAAIVRSILTLAADLGLRCVAEGVEDAAVAAALRGLGCRTAQGYHFAGPLVADEVVHAALARSPILAAPGGATP